jgi:biotin carboxyl carrier protein
MNLELVENLVRLIGEYPLSDIEVDVNGQRIAVRRSLGVTLPTLPASDLVASDLALPPVSDTTILDSGLASEIAEELSPRIETLNSPMVGIFYHADPPLPYAADLRPGLVVGYIESMKLRNDVVAEESGRITDVLVEDGAPVEYGQSLFRFTAFPV